MTELVYEIRQLRRQYMRKSLVRAPKNASLANERANPTDRSGNAAKVVVLSATLADTMSAQRLKLWNGSDRPGKSYNYPSNLCISHNQFKIGYT